MKKNKGFLSIYSKCVMSLFAIWGVLVQPQPIYLIYEYKSDDKDVLFNDWIIIGKDMQVTINKVGTDFVEQTCKEI